MSFSELIAWAWREKSPVHKNRSNLVIHIVALPLLVPGQVLALTGALVEGRLAVAGTLCIIVSIAVQGFGHSLERQQVHPFTGPRDFLGRLYAEQFRNFWRFLVSGQRYSSFTSRNDEQIAQLCDAAVVARRR